MKRMTITIRAAQTGPRALLICTHLVLSHLTSSVQWDKVAKNLKLS